MAPQPGPWPYDSWQYAHRPRCIQYRCNCSQCHCFDYNFNDWTFPPCGLPYPPGPPRPLRQPNPLRNMRADITKTLRELRLSTQVKWVKKTLRLKVRRGWDEWSCYEQREWMKGQWKGQEWMKRKLCEAMAAGDRVGDAERGLREMMGGWRGEALGGRLERVDKIALLGEIEEGGG